MVGLRVRWLGRWSDRRDCGWEYILEGVFFWFLVLSFFLGYFWIFLNMFYLFFVSQLLTRASLECLSLKRLPLSLYHK